MSMVHCNNCGWDIDTDFSNEHFVEDTEICAPGCENPEVFTLYTGNRIMLCDGCPQTKTWLPNREKGYWWGIEHSQQA